MTFEGVRKKLGSKHQSMVNMLSHLESVVQNTPCLVRCVMSKEVIEIMNEITSNFERLVLGCIEANHCK